MKKTTIHFLHAAALSLLALAAGCGSSDTDTGTDTATGPCKGPGAGKVEPIECHLGACNVLVPGCDNGSPASCPPTEPAADELCDDGVDNNCNGQIDEGCTCADGAMKPCYSGSPATRNTGRCHDGVQTCQGGVWLECKGDVRPTKEVCDTFDNSCDGKIDEGCACSDGAQQSCYGAAEVTAGAGMCKAGVQTCASGAWGECAGAVLPQVETCDAADNDCNGEVDNGKFGTGAACEVPGGVGICKTGLTECGASGLYCKANVTPITETCDGLDNDCDGVIDNGNFCCADGKQAGPESDVDCGAVCDMKCDNGKACHTPEDCQSGNCVNAICSP